jgi:predicted dithiol-disulfide oxidoreductase (DUF899 family)
MTSNQIVSNQQWLTARVALLEKEKQLTRQLDEMARQRRQLPWTKIEKNYTFESPCGTVALADLFGNHAQLFIYHFMFGPNWKEGCPSCSMMADSIGGTLPHLAARDVSLVFVSRAPVEKIQAFKQRMGWTFPWVSSLASDFNFDFHVSFKPEQQKTGKVDYNFTLQKFPSEEAPGASFFFKEPGTADIFHTYSTYGRGLDALIFPYTILDMAPKGRDEDQFAFPMQWVRHHDRYATNDFIDAEKPYWPKIAPATSSTAVSAGQGSTSSCSCAAGEKP